VYLGLPGRLSWHSLPRLSPYLLVYLVLALIYPLTLWRCWRERHKASFPWERVALLSLVGALLLVEVAFSLNWLRVFAVAFAGIILLFWNADRASDRVGMIRPYAVVLMWVGLAGIAFRQTRAAYVHESSTLHLRGGDVAVSPQAWEKLHWLMLHTIPDQFFLQADWPGMYLPLRLRNPLFVDAIIPEEETRPQEIAAAIQQLEAKRVQYILWQARLDSAEFSTDPVLPLRSYLHLKYTQVHGFAGGETVWERNEFISRR
jgi:hypothetical protein